MIVLPKEHLPLIMWLNGEFISSQASADLLRTHSLHYSGAIFDGIKAYNGKIFKGLEHMERLVSGAQAYHMVPNYTPQELVKAAEELLIRNNLTDCYIRPLIWAEAESTKIAAPIYRTNIFIAAWQHKHTASNQYDVILSPWTKPHPTALPPQVKSSGNYSNILLAVREATAQGYSDALMLDWRGYVAELTSSNIFFIKNNSLYTPIADAFLNGFTRQTVIHLAREKFFEVIEKYISPQEICEFDECFATGTAAGIRPVDSITLNIGDYQKISFSKNTITSIIADSYNKLIGAVL